MEGVLPVRKIQRQRSVSWDMSPLSNQEATEKLRAGMRFQWPQNMEHVNTQNQIGTVCNADVMSVLKPGNGAVTL